MIHELKCWPEFYQPIVRGTKRFDVRKGLDRTYQVGDFLNLCEWDPRLNGYTGEHTVREITFVLQGPPILPDDYWVLSLKQAPAEIWAQVAKSVKGAQP